ncbi:nucleotidyl transferase AbiEii/AbiGii toxin family protein [Candidatus Woesebacteria bacterium]|nr:nucleotidyl transferase AbiEii/AbiGii toxin family protein [Candidatus Woesebacteria bacterium]
MKVDFVYQPYKSLERGKKYHNLWIASIWDIAVDKLYTIFHRAKARDFVDLYFAIREINCNFDQLLNALEEKYQAQFDKVSLFSRLPIVKDVADFPTMLVPFERKQMEEFYLNLAKNFGDKIFQ